MGAKLTEEDLISAMKEKETYSRWLRRVMESDCVGSGSGYEYDESLNTIMVFPVGDDAPPYRDKYRMWALQTIVPVCLVR